MVGRKRTAREGLFTGSPKRVHARHLSSTIIVKPSSNSASLVTEKAGRHLNDEHQNLRREFDCWFDDEYRRQAYPRMVIISPRHERHIEMIPEC